jgi:hypothetical protein
LLYTNTLYDSCLSPSLIRPTAIVSTQSPPILSFSTVLSFGPERLSDRDQFLDS